MAKALELREPERGEKTNLLRELLAKHPEVKNMELAAIYLDRMRKAGIKEERDLAKIAQAFSQEKTTAKKMRLETEEVAPTPIPATPTAPKTPVKVSATANGNTETPAMTTLRQLVGLLGKDGAKKLVDSL
jgi:hypothetical protein